MLRDHSWADYAGRRITIMGLGSFGGGEGAVRFLAERGARLTISDQRSAQQLGETMSRLADVPITRWSLGGHREEDFLHAELVVVNPAVIRQHPWLVWCRARGIPLTSEMNLFWQHQRGTILAVTGSNGKSTTTALLHHMLRTAGLRTWLGGNLGRSLLPHVDQIQPGDFVVLELSSFQLLDLDRLQVSPHGAIVTNFTPNHLDWHTSLEHYRYAKQTILRWQTSRDWYVLPADDPELSHWRGRGRRIVYRLLRETAASTSDTEATLQQTVLHSLQLPGEHNLRNALAAATAAQQLGIRSEQIGQALKTYQPLPHRLQHIAHWQGRDFYNDSLATTPESTQAALRAFSRPLIVLVGGYDKHLDLAPLCRELALRAKGVVLIGQTAPSLYASLQALPSRQAWVSSPQPDLSSALKTAIAQSAAGDVIVLSPACASYDWFKNYADRGEQFTRLVHHWIAQHAESMSAAA
ncbi:MAG: UDP-N-acetylmuramoylalanine--D-glutamate ligase [Planctomycetaceae bacterium]|nr:MAG: UDP-N-acetylmuramoylalanine--D-glutamate ligase [Planctomycetaceae bacterium]